jgi:hypothetical protein
MISDNPCEICSEKSMMAMNGDDSKLHFCCEKHVQELWDKIGKP